MEMGMFKNGLHQILIGHPIQSNQQNISFFFKQNSFFNDDKINEITNEINGFRFNFNAHVQTARMK